MSRWKTLLGLPETQGTYGFLLVLTIDALGAGMYLPTLYPLLSSHDWLFSADHWLDSDYRYDLYASSDLAYR